MDNNSLLNHKNVKGQAVIITIIAILIVVAIAAIVYYAVNPSTGNYTGNVTQNNTNQTNQTGNMTNQTMGETYNISISNFSFNPQNLNIAAGDKVTWTNNDNTTHTVTSINGSELNSGNLAPGDTYSHTFNQNGNFSYHCSIHPSMTGNIVVGMLNGTNQNQTTNQTNQTGNMTNQTGNNTATVTIQNQAYHPAQLNVTRGTNVFWTNMDSQSQTVTFDTILSNGTIYNNETNFTNGNSSLTNFTNLSSGPISLGQSYNYTFNELGSYPYHSDTSTNMMGVITVIENNTNNSGA